MPTTIGVNLVLSSGKTNLSLQLFASGVLLNTGGDALVEVGTSGFFQASVDEVIVGTLDAIVLEGAVAVYGGTLYLGQTQVDRVAPAPSADEISTTISTNIEDGANNWDSAADRLAVVASARVWGDLITATLTPESRTASTVVFAASHGALRGMVLHLWDIGENKIVHIAVVTEIVSATSAVFDPPYAGSATVDRVSFYRLGSLIPPTANQIQSGLALEATLEAMQGTGFDTATDSLEEIRAAVDGIEITALTGPWTRTITVADSVSGDPIQNATVRFFRTGETGTKATNVSGVASFTVEAAAWSYAIVANGYAGASGTVVVGASGDTPVVMVATVPATPTNPNNATLRVTCIGEDSQIEPGAVVSIRMIEAPASQVGFGYDGTIATFTANSNGIAEREVARGATYEIRREGTYKQWQQFVMPTDEDLILIESFVQP